MFASNQIKLAHSLNTNLFIAEEPQLYQHTLTGSVYFKGIGVHSGQQVSLALHPAPVNTGYLFIRSDITKEQQEIPATWAYVTETRMNTTLTNQYGVQIRTVEHILAALSGCGIDNAFIEVNGPEVPIMDGSSVAFVQKITQTGRRSQSELVKRIRILKPVQVTEGQSTAFLLPADHTRLYVRFNASGRMADQSYTFYPEEDDFISLISAARTFGFYEDAQKVYDLGLARGASLENTVVFDQGQVLNPEGLRYSDECVRHKILDAIGDLSLAGGRLIGHYDGTNPSHYLNNKLLRALFADPSAWRLEIDS
ncbi:MAG TPA: UDP-3-O-acyl-N-acetylglucosamine deacetylase [Candidatus Nitrosotenuis sp.]|jgi:UDP-3-O-[3-hydroxymyristoyl] N-acetylglucosamine deacetylase|nr:UDP-3-O-acyl-N-acetylglucosamine deacetylase [Candidatus Nitrosotenuis sp.]